jgi:hypothetical protein
MASNSKLGAALAACALVVGSAPALAQDPTFNFSTVPASIIDNIPIDNGATNAVTVGLTGGSGVTATFTDPNDSGNFYFSAYEAQFIQSSGAPVVLSETGSSGDTLDISFSQAISAIQFGFSLGNLTAGDFLNVAAYNGSTLVNTFSSATNTTYGGNQWSTGLFDYEGAPVTNLVITGSVGAASGNDLASINITPTPEPATWGMLGLGLLTLVAVARRRRH